MSQQEITIFAPASVSNVAAGFDVLGFAVNDIGDTIRLKERTDKKIVIQSIEGADLPYEPEKNIVGVVLESMRKSLNIDQGFDVSLVKRVMPGSGLGSSGSSAAGTAVALNEYLGRPLSAHELVKYAMEGENFVSGNRHADNVAPCIYGGFTLIRSYDPLDVVPIKLGKMLFVAIIHPQIQIKTSDARRILPKSISLKDATTQWGNLAGLVMGLSYGDMNLISKSMVDVIAEPVRKKLIPEFDKAKEKALELGALGYTISGSGPAMFAFSEHRATCELITKEIAVLYQEAGIPIKTHVSQISSEGAKRI